MPVLAAEGVALLVGLYAALLLLGLPVPALRLPIEEAHGPLLVLGFLSHVMIDAERGAHGVFEVGPAAR